MTLGFSTKINGCETDFVAKIWATLIIYDVKDADLGGAIDMQQFNHFKLSYERIHGGFPGIFKIGDVSCMKKHSLRQGDKWKAGMKIHPVIHNRTALRFQFAPTVLCPRVDDILIDQKKGIYINGKKYCNWHIDSPKLKELAYNDGLSPVVFFNYFNQPFDGQIIHWTDQNLYND
jgi:hypothetical protein